MRIEAGKMYRLRDGKKMRAYATDGNEPYIVHGALYCPDREGWIEHSWMPNGQFDMQGATELDIVSEWVEEETRTVWLNVYEGYVFGRPTEAGAISDAHKKDILARVPVTFTFKRGEGLG